MTRTSIHAAQYPRAGVGVLLADARGRVLLTLRKGPPEAGFWSIVGGKLNFLEPLEDCAIREAREEVGVQIAIESLLCVTNHRLPAEGQHWVSPAFLAHILRGKVRNCESHKTSEVRWFGLGQLPPNLTITARSAIDAFAAHKRSVAVFSATHPLHVETPAGISFRTPPRK